MSPLGTVTKRFGNPRGGAGLFLPALRSPLRPSASFALTNPGGFYTINSILRGKEAAHMHTNAAADDEAQQLARLDTQPEEAMTALVEQYAPLICHVAGKYLTDPEDVKECVNDVFTEVYLHRAEYDRSKGSLASWIGTIARNRAISLYRKRRRDLPLPEDGTEADGPDGTAELEQAMDVEQAISQLSDTDQQIIRMKYYGSMSIQEIAETLQIPYETLKKRHTRSIRQLRKLLLVILTIAALLILAACGVIQLLRHFGFLPGYGVTSDPGASCYLMQERAPTVEAEEYTAWIKSAKLYNGELTLEYRLEVPEQPFETEYDEYGIATTCPLSFTALLYGEDGTLLADQTFNLSRSVSDYFHGSGKGNLSLPQDLMDQLRQNGQMALELHITGIVFDGRAWPDAVIPFTLAEVREQVLEGYPSIYDESTGGVLLDSRMEGGVLTMDIYPISNGTMEFFGGLTLIPGYPIGVSEYEYCEPLTIVGEDGTEYTGEPVEACLSYYENSVVSFTFPDAPPGTYTLKLPYVYMLLKQEESLAWNLRSGKLSRQVISFPGGSFRTASITELEEPVQDGHVSFDVPVVNTHTWEIAVQCQFDSQEITALTGGYPTGPELFLRVKAEMLARYLLYHENIHILGDCSISPGRWDPESGYLVYQISMDDLFTQTHDLKHVSCNPAPMNFMPMILRYDHPMELEFEVAP